MFYQLYFNSSTITYQTNSATKESLEISSLAVKKMAGFQVKAEQESTPEPKEALGLFVDDRVGPVLPQGSSSKTALEVLLPDPEWRRCEAADCFKRVKIKEFAAANAYSTLHKMLKTMKLHLASNPSCQPRINKIRKFSLPCSYFSSGIITFLLECYMTNGLDRCDSRSQERVQNFGWLSWNDRSWKDNFA
jgi:hypothetical protein